ncbi:hypothetical protein [Thalassotalea euphylliae]|uniref:hypothetical protein n=1 Tax=Thalassotalea euphylliae TaxID=1655234 RepID=UPI0011C04E40|nr:hypothetical protein [Thalassotalea euphylliae]
MAWKVPLGLTGAFCMVIPAEIIGLASSYCASVMQFHVAILACSLTELNVAIAAASALSASTGKYAFVGKTKLVAW